jgi:triphosphatase
VHGHKKCHTNSSSNSNCSPIRLREAGAFPGSLAKTWANPSAWKNLNPCTLIPLGNSFAKRVEELESLYFDTSGEQLRENGVSLRIRRDGKRSVQTIKWLKHSDLFDRGQSETEISGQTPDWKAARGTALEPLLCKKLRRSLKPLFKTKVRRTIYPVATEAAEIEIAVDDGSIQAGRRSAPIRELELELKRGQCSELFRVARELSSAIPGRLSVKSKAERGYELLNGRVPVAVKAREIGLYPGTSAAEAFRIIARSCLAQIVANEAGVRSRDSEAFACSCCSRVLIGNWPQYLACRYDLSIEFSVKRSSSNGARRADGRSDRHHRP